MVFSSYIFVLVFLPIALLGFYALRERAGIRGAMAWLVVVSLIYFGWWNPKYLGLLFFSLAFNFAVGGFVGSDRPVAHRRAALIAGIAVDLALLAYFKYATFIVDTIDALFQTGYTIGPIVLPIAISFFTFQQIAYLVDAYQGGAREYRFLDYVLFVSFFPQLIAGPIVHHAEMMPQFERRERRDATSDLAIGLTLFIMGLWKKVMLADSIAAYADPVFAVTDAGNLPTTLDAWTGTLAYTLQLYFDFSGYSDMAIGIARMFGILLPLNFHSPYKSTSIVDFWRRWHITLSRFLRDYLYIPLGGNRKGQVRRYLNLMITMLLGGLWHGAGWNFVLWGFLHGAFLMVNHAWFTVSPRLPLFKSWQGPSRHAFAVGLTFLAAMFAWVPFRATTWAGVGNMYQSLLGWTPTTVSLFDDPFTAWGLLLAGLAIVWFLPNTQQIMAPYQPTVEYAVAPERWPAADRPRLGWVWRPGVLIGVGAAMILVFTVMRIARGTAFIYFQF